VLEIQEFFAEEHQTVDFRVKLQFELGNDYFNRYNEAIASCQRAIALNPYDWVAFSNQGFALMKLERYTEAIRCFESVLEIAPNCDRAIYQQACCYALQGDIERAIEDLTQPIHLNPEKYREMAKNDTDFDTIRQVDRFGALVSISDGQMK
jgi:tetratricopeptide (TPR) repeat protein